MRRRTLLVMSLAVLVAAPCFCAGFFKRLPTPLLNDLREADHFELVSLNPGNSFLELDHKPEEKEGRLHGWRVLGSVVVGKEADRHRVVRAVARGVNHSGPVSAACFFPRHAIRARRGKRVVDVLICYQCSNLYVFENGKQQEGHVTGEYSKPVLNEVLQAAGVPLAPEWR